MVNENNLNSDKPTIIIEAMSNNSSINLQEIWKYRELLLFFSWRDITVRYVQTILGLLWAILQPFTTMIIFTIFFGNLAKIATNGIPYPIFSFTALVPWTFFTAGLTSASASMTNNANLLKKIYFPRVILPISGLISALADFTVSFIILLIMTMGYIIFGSNIPDAAGEVAILSITPNVLFLPLFIGLAFVTALGFGLWLAALNVRFRDIRYISPVLIRLWMFITPVIYPVDLISENWVFLYSLNPMVSVIDGFRWALLGVGSFPAYSLAIGSVISFIVLIFGLIFFHRTERIFADIV